MRIRMQCVGRRYLPGTTPPSGHLVARLGFVSEERVGPLRTCRQSQLSWPSGGRGGDRPGGPLDKADDDWTWVCSH
jgi:hypothetical protein